MSYSIVIGTADRTTLLIAGTLSYTLQANHDDTASCALKTTAAGFIPAVGQSFYVYESVDAENKFGGVINTVTIEKLEAGVSTSKTLRVEMTISPFKAIASRRTVAYSETAVTAKFVVQKVISALSTDGVTEGTVNTGASDIGEYDAPLNTLSQIMDDMCTASGYQWWIDPDKLLHFYNFDLVISAPYTVTETGNYTVDSYSYDIDQYANKIFVQGHPDVGSVVICQDTAEQTARAAIEGGSGIYGAVIVDENIVTTADATVAGDAALKWAGIIPQKLVFTAYDNLSSWYPGYRVTANLPSIGLTANTSFNIDSVTTSDQGTYFQAQVNCSVRKSDSFSNAQAQTGIEFLGKLVNNAGSNNAGSGVSINETTGVITPVVKGGVVQVWVETAFPSVAKNKDVLVDTDDYSRYDMTAYATTGTLTSANGEFIELTGTAACTLTITSPGTAAGTIAKYIKNSSSQSWIIGATVDGSASPTLAAGASIVLFWNNTDWRNVAGSAVETDPVFTAWDKDYADLSNKPTLGTAAAKNIPATGNATATEVVYGSDTRLSDSRTASDVSAWAKSGTKPSYTYSEVGADVAGAAAAVTPTTLGLVIGTNVLAQRTFGTAANNATGDFATAAQGTLATNAVPNTRTVNSKSLSSNITLSPDDLDDAATTHKFVSSADITNLGNLSNTNSGDQNAASVSIADAGSIITATTVEGALQENRTAINLNTAKATNAAHTGDVTGSAALTIVSAAVTYAKIQHVSATDKLLGRVSAGAGDIEEIACTAAGRALLDDTTAAAQLITLGVNATAAELNILDGATLTVTELNYVDGVTSSIQTQLNAKQASGTYSTASFTSIIVSGQSTILATTAGATLEFVAGTNVTITTNTSNKTVTFAASTSIATHGITHQLTGGDTFNVTGMSGLLTTAQTPVTHASTHAITGTDTLNVTGLSGLLTTSQNPVAHATSHGATGSDTITALSGLVTVGTISTGVWHGTKIDDLYGGTGLTAIATGSILVSHAANSYSALSSTTALTILQNNSGTMTWAATTGTGNNVLGTSPTITNPIITAITSLATVGTISTGVWQATHIDVGYGGTGISAIATGSVLVSTAANTLKALSSTTALTILQNNSGVITWSSASGGGQTAVFTSILVSGQSTILATTAAGTLEFVQGTGITITTNTSNKTVTFASTVTAYSFFMS